MCKTCTRSLIYLSTPLLTLNKVQSSTKKVQRRGILEVLRDSLEDRPQQQGRDMAEAEVRYKLIIDPSEDDSLIRLLFSFGVLQREETRMYVCSNFPGDSHLQKVSAYTCAYLHNCSIILFYSTEIL